MSKSNVFEPDVVLSALLNRVSCAKLTQPAPDERAMDIILKAAMRAPDHASLRPYHYLVFQGESALIKLGELFAKAQASLPDATENSIARAKQLPLRAPMVIVAVAKVEEHPKVPKVEQIITTSCGLHAMLIALQRLGYGGYWRTGSLTTNKKLKQLLDLNYKDEIVGFLYVGTSSSKQESAKSLDWTSHVTFFK